MKFTPKVRLIKIYNWKSMFQDVHKLYTQLGNPIGKFHVPDQRFNHLDFMWGIDAKELLYDTVIGLMAQYNS